MQHLEMDQPYCLVTSSPDRPAQDTAQYKAHYITTVEYFIIVV